MGGRSKAGVRYSHLADGAGGEAAVIAGITDKGLVGVLSRIVRGFGVSGGEDAGGSEERLCSATYRYSGVGLG